MQTMPFFTNLQKKTSSSSIQCLVLFWSLYGCYERVDPPFIMAFSCMLISLTRLLSFSVTTALFSTSLTHSDSAERCYVKCGSQATCQSPYNILWWHHSWLPANELRVSWRLCCCNRGLSNNILTATVRPFELYFKLFMQTCFKTKSALIHCSIAFITVLFCSVTHEMNINVLSCKCFGIDKMTSKN